MNQYSLFMATQYLGILGLFIESWVVFHNWKSKLHSYLLFGCLAMLVDNIGYLLELEAKSEEAYITALKLSYAGRIWVAFALFMFAFEFVHVEVPRPIVRIQVFVHVLIYATILTLDKHTLYYPDMHFEWGGVFPKVVHGNGIVHHIFFALQVLYIVIGLGLLFVTLFKEKQRLAKMRITTVIASFIVQSAFLVVQTFGLLPITHIYDVTMFGSLIGAVIMILAIFRLDLLGTRELAREYVVDRISEAIIAVDSDGIIQYLNEPAKALFPDIKKDPEEPLKVITQAIGAHETITIDGRIYTPEENDLVYEGRDYGKLYALVDDTEHFRYMEELEEQKNIANYANEAKSRFLAHMSHEIRTPINAVIGMDEMILRESSESSIRGYAANIMSAGKTLLTLIGDILDLSKVEEGKMEIIPVEYELSALVNELVNMIKQRASRKGLKFEAKVDEHIPHTLFGDEIRIRQCVLNLLTNAVKYTEHGSVTMSVLFELKDAENIILRFRVTDTGIGMKEEDLKRLFAPYERIEEKRNRHIEGTGLGMSITMQLLELMGSKLEVVSEYGKGSEFSFDITQKVVDWDETGDYSEHLKEVSGISEVYHERFHAPDARILVVDDTEMNLTVIQGLLKKTLIKIDTALSGKIALDMARDTEYDVLFIDHMMPDMDGIETLKEIRKSGKNKETPAIALTANAISGARAMYMREGFNDYLAKPIDGDDLEEMLCRILPENKLQKASEVSETKNAAAGSSEAAGIEGEGADNAGSAGKTNLDESVDNTRGAGGAGKDNNYKLIGLLNAIDELDVKTGIKNCATADGYMAVISVFHNTAKQKADEIEKLWNEKDIKNYTIKVHALKSSARIIGAKELSDLAEKLEFAGKDGNTEFIDNNTEELLTWYRELGESLNVLDIGNSELPDIDEESMRDAYTSMIEIADSMDYGLMDELLKSLKGYNIKAEDVARIRVIEELLNKLDFEAIMEEAKKALE